MISEFKIPYGIQNALQKPWGVQFPSHSSSLALQDAEQNSTYDRYYKRALNSDPEGPSLRLREHFSLHSSTDLWLSAEAASQGAN